MAILKMQTVEICGLRAQRKQILECLQRKGLVEVGKYSADDLSEVDTSASVGVFQKNIATVSKALDILKIVSPEKGGLLSSLNGRTAVTEKQYAEFKVKSESVMKKAYEIISLDRKISEGKGERARIKTQIGALAPYLNLDVSMVNAKTDKTEYIIGALPGEHTLSDIEIALNEKADFSKTHIEVLSADKNQTCLFIICLKTEKEQIEEALREMGFTYPSFIVQSTPAERKARLEQDLEKSLSEETQAKAKLKEMANCREELRFALDYYGMRLEKYEVIEKLSYTDHAFFLKGYIPEKYSAKLKKDLEKRFDCTVELSEADDDAPVVMENNGFAQPLIGVISAYGLPGKGDIDPLCVMSLFYYLLFGLMFSDAGYGILMALVCGIIMIVHRKSDAPIMTSVKMFFFCGISTAIWGFVMGSFFGDALEVISQNFLGKNWTTPCLWFSPMKDPMKMLMFSMALGIVHMFTGLGIAGYQCIRDKKFLDLIFDVVSWFVLLIALLLMLMGASLFEGIAGFKLTYTDTQSLIIKIAAIVGAAIVVLFGGRESKNPLKRLMKGLYGLYGVTGWLGDVISYSRLLALGLATGVVGSVVNQMGAMIGNPVAFAIIFIIGHLLNFLINVLGAYVHTNRLQFVEFFGKFYSGGGREFAPFNIKGKYYTVKEDNKNG